MHVEKQWAVQMKGFMRILEGGGLLEGGGSLSEKIGRSILHLISTQNIPHLASGLVAIISAGNNKKSPASCGGSKKHDERLGLLAIFLATWC